MIALQIGMTASPQNRGGLDRYFFDLLRACEGTGVQTRGLVIGSPSDLASQGIDGIETYAHEGTSLLARWSALRRAVKHRLPGSDLVVSHFAPYAFPVLDRIRSRPTVVHFHGSWAREAQAEGSHGLGLAAKFALERLVYRGGSRFVVLTKAVSAALQRDFGVPPELIRVVPGGVDIKRFHIGGTRLDARRTLNLPPDRPMILTARRLVHAKGIEVLIDAVAAMRKRLPDVLLVVVGTGPIRQELEQIVRERELERSIHFAGFLDDEDLQHAYRAADLFVVPSISTEGFGLVVIESLACGTPVMVTPVAGLPESISSLDAGLIFAGTAPDQMADGMLAALEGTLALPTPAACRTYAESFDWSRIVERVRTVYEEVA
jgi:glycogen(starch) synthase